MKTQDPRVDLIFSNFTMVKGEKCWKHSRVRHSLGQAHKGSSGVLQISHRFHAQNRQKVVKSSADEESELTSEREKMFFQLKCNENVSVHVQSSDYQEESSRAAKNTMMKEIRKRAR